MRVIFQLKRVRDTGGRKHKSERAGVMFARFDRFLPLAGLAFGLIMTVVWMGLVGYGLVKLL